MKKRLLSLFLIVICLCSLAMLASCDYVLDLIFGPNNPSDSSGTDEPPAHTHQMSPQKYDGETCVGQSEITYYKCSGCGKCYLDEQGANEILDISNLEQGHLFLVKTTDDEHYSECSLCHTEQDDSRGKHSCDRYWYNPDEHYRLCDVCGAKFDVGAHDETGSCTVCGRQADYKAMCNSHYGYEQLTSFERGDGMKKLYNKIDEEVRKFHDNANSNANPNTNFGTDASTGQELRGYSLNRIDSSDCFISMDEAKVTIASYVHDNPLYYWIGKRFSVAPDSNGNKAMVVILGVVDDYANGKDRVAQNEIIYAEIDKYLSMVANETDPYNITLALHDKIIDNINYAEKADGTAEDEIWAHNIVGVFDRKLSVCEGYAKAYQLLLNACGVNNVYVIGTSKLEGDDEPIGHAWNIVQLSDGNWYWYDLTWDDQPHLKDGKTYMFFCKADGEFDGHTATKNDVTLGANYLYKLPQASSTPYKPSDSSAN